MKMLWYNVEMEKEDGSWFVVDKGHQLTFSVAKRKWYSLTKKYRSHPRMSKLRIRVLLCEVVLCDELS